MTQIKIINAGGTLECDAISWSEEQSCDPAMREIPLNSNGELVDTGTFIISNRKLTFTIRLTDTQKDTLNDIFNENVTIVITAKTELGEDYPCWEYTGWLSKVLKEYSYSKEGSDEREWEIELEFYCSSFYYIALPIEIEPFDWAYFKNKGEIWFNQESGGYTGYPIYITDPFAGQGGGYSEPLACDIIGGSDAIFNGGFELGTLGFWVTGGDINVVTEPKDGTYSAKYDSVGNQHYILQNLLTEVSIGGCLTVSSTFSAWVKCSSSGKMLQVMIIFNTGNGIDTKTITFYSPNTDWFQINLLPYIQEGQLTDSGDTIKSGWRISTIGFYFTQGYYWWLDSVVLQP